MPCLYRPCNICPLTDAASQWPWAVCSSAGVVTARPRPAVLAHSPSAPGLGGLSVPAGQMGPVALCFSPSLKTWKRSGGGGSWLLLESGSYQPGRVSHPRIPPGFLQEAGPDLGVHSQASGSAGPLQASAAWKPCLTWGDPFRASATQKTLLCVCWFSWLFFVVTDAYTCVIWKGRRKTRPSWALEK